jgi:hypothetical protein
LEPNFALALNWHWLAFALDAIAAEARPEGGVVMLKYLDTRTVRTNPMLLGFQPAGFAQISIQYSAPAPIDWNSIRTNLTHLQLATAYELLSLSGATPESQQVEPGVVRTQFTLPLSKLPPSGP